MSKPHLLHVEIDHGLTLRFSCQAESATTNGCGTHYENTEPRPEPPEGPTLYPSALGGMTMSVDGQRVAVDPDSDEARAWSAFYEAEDAYEPWVPTDECWVANHVLECVLEGMSREEFLEELGHVGQVTGPIPVRVWNEGDFEECIPRMALWIDEEAPDA